jgi:hypothetical protein
MGPASSITSAGAGAAGAGGGGADGGHAGAAGAPAPCEGIERTETGHCYVFDPAASASWDDARATCLALAGGAFDLASITDEAERNWIDATVNPQSWTWIGGHDRVTEGVFEWANGEIWDYAPWKDGAPDGGESADCVYLYPVTGGDQNDAFEDWYCDSARRYLCERGP